jgi:type IX secretion system PorP/SprF family membrane protein
MKKILIIIGLLLLLVTEGKSQYFNVFSQYVSNGLLINPAYTGSREVLSINFMFRQQYAGFEGAPKYETFSIHTPLKNANIGIGLLFLNEQEGPARNTHAYFNYAFRIHVGKGRLALGLKAGIHYASYDFKNLLVNDAGDYVFSSKNNYFILPNFGVGLYYYSRKAFLGFSVPYLLSYKKSTSANKGTTIYNNVNNYFFHFAAGYLLDISKNFKIKPTTLFKSNLQLENQLDLNMNFIFFNSRLWLGGAYRLKQAISGSFEIQVNPQLLLGYTYDYTGGQVKNFNFPSHEICIRYEFSYKIKAFNPRYF